MLPASILDTHSPAIAMFHLLSVPLISTPVCVYFPPLYGSPSGRVRQNTSSDQCSCQPGSPQPKHYFKELQNSYLAPQPNVVNCQNSNPALIYPLCFFPSTNLVSFFTCFRSTHTRIAQESRGVCHYFITIAQNMTDTWPKLSNSPHNKANNSRGAASHDLSGIS